MAHKALRAIATSALLMAAIAGTSFHVAGAQAAEGDGMESAGPYLAGEISKAAEVMGFQGSLIVRSPQRWAQIRAALASLGWKSPDDDPEISRRSRSEPGWKWLGWKSHDEDPLAKLDFTREVIVGAFYCGGFFPPRPYRGQSDAKETEVRFLLSCPDTIGDNFPNWIFAFVAAPKTERIKTLVAHFDPTGKFENAWIVRTETFDAMRGDIVDGLSAVITHKDGKIKAGSDILVDFKLQFQSVKGYPAVPDAFNPVIMRARDSAFVWDGTYSNGYRNCAYLVVAPDGSTQILRKPEQAAWVENAPRLVEITAAKPYVQPQGSEGKTAQSLKELGLDTSKPGTYQITGVYTETGGPGQTEDGKKVEIWGGNIASAPVEVDVEK